MTQPLATASDVTLPLARPARLLSLDVFRGATVAAMILVNNPGSWGAIYWPLAHADWHGCTPTDLIMPFFLFIVGVSIVYAMDSKKADTAGHGGLLFKAAKRAGVLFLLGLILAIFPGSPTAFAQTFTDPLARLSELRIMGVLQRIAVVYFFCVLLFLKSSPTGWIKWSVVLLAGYWAALTFIPVPSATGWLPASLDQKTNLVGAIDRAILTESHMYKITVAKERVPFDPEGLFSTVAAIASGLAGLWAGYVLKKSPAPIHARLTRLYTAGTLCCIAAFAWQLFHPLNKPLWTSSYALLNTGLALTALALCYHLWDAPPSVEGARRWRPPAWLTAPLAAYGVNAITAFFASGIMVRAMGLIPLQVNDKHAGLKGWLYANLFTPNITDPHLASLAWALCFVALWTGIMLVMYRMKWIIKV